MQRFVGWSLLFCTLCAPAVASSLAGTSAPAELIPGHWTPGMQPDGNSVLFDAPDGLVLLDTGRHIAHAQRLIETIRARGRPLRWIVNSHWHLDHIGGNAELRAAFPQARVMGSDAVIAARSGFLARYRAQLSAELATLPAAGARRTAVARELAIIDNQAAQTPDVSVRGGGEQVLAGHRMVVGLARHAATAGDVWLYDPVSRTLASGDLVTLPVPFFDTACAERWEAELDTLAAQPFERLLPGHGPALDRAGFERYRTAFAALRACAAGSAAAERCTDGWLADVGALVPAGQQALARSYLGYYLEQHLRAAPERQRAHCPR
jgi:glyoxylase-like metal-dependent hydrolase (beta-lactamase superfamily II)